MADRDIDLRITAKDDASKTIKGVAEQVEALDGETTVKVDADTRSATSDLGKLEQELDALDLESARELRIDVRADNIRSDIEGIANQLERLDDPMAITVKTDELRQAEQDLKDLAELADRKYEVQVDVPPPKTPVKQPFDDIVTGADQANSAVANMVGNTGQDLGELAGITGSAGVAVGQLAEYFADTAIEAKAAGQGVSGAISSFAKAAVPIAGIAAAMWAISKGADQAKERTEDLATSVDDLSTATDALFTKTAQDTLGQMFMRAALDGKDLNDQLTELAETNTVGARRMLEHADAIGINTDVQNTLASAIGKVEQEEAQAARSTELYGSAADKAAAASESLADEQQEIADKAAAAAEKLNASAEAANAIAEANRDAADIAIDFAAAQDDFATKLAESNTKLAEAGEGTAAYRDVLRETTTTAAGMADEAVNLADAQARAAGQTLNASDKTSVWNRSMTEAARNASGPLRDSIINYIATVNGIPPEKVSEIIADPDYATIEAASSALDDASASRDSQITAEAYTAQAERDLNEAARTRTAKIIAQAAGNLNFGWGTGNQRVGSTAAAESLAAPQQTNVTVHLSRASSGRDLDRTVSRWARVNGRH